MHWMKAKLDETWLLVMITVCHNGEANGYWIHRAQRNWQLCTVQITRKHLTRSQYARSDCCSILIAVSQIDRSTFEYLSRIMNLDGKRSRFILP